MIKPDLGTKRVCPSCAARFYDLQKRPIECPKCAYTFEPEVLLRQRRTRVPEPVVKAVVEADDEEAEAEDEEETADEEEEEVEVEVVAEVDEPVVATEDGEAEEGEVAPGMSVDEGEEPEEFEEEIEEDEDDDDLLEEVEEDEDDVTDIIDADLEKDEP